MRKNTGLLVVEDGKTTYSDPYKEIMYQIIERAVCDALGLDTWIKLGDKYIPKHNLGSAENKEIYEKSPAYYDALNSAYYSLRHVGRKELTERRVVKEEAKRWILENGGWFEELCNALGIPPEEIRKRIE
jgi:hypothetical protein